MRMYTRTCAYTRIRVHDHDLLLLRQILVGGYSKFEIELKFEVSLCKLKLTRPHVLLHHISLVIMRLAWAYVYSATIGW